MRYRPRHLQIGWCWGADIDGEPRMWGIYGHVTDGEAVQIVLSYEGDSVIENPSVFRDFRRSVPCHRANCECDVGSHLEMADGPGRGASPYTWVEAAS